MAQPYVEFLERTYDWDTAARLYANGVSEFPAEALLRLGRFLQFRYPTEAKELFRLALQRHSGPAAVELYKMLRLEGNDREANEVLDRVLCLGKWFALDVSRLFEEDRQIMVASELKKRAEDIDPTGGQEYIRSCSRSR